MTMVNSIMKALRRVVSDSKKGTTGATDTILYSEHDIKGRWRTPTKHHRPRVWDYFELNLFWKSNTYLIPLQQLIFLFFTHFYH